MPKKAKYFFSSAIQNWDAEFYVKVDDNIDVDLGKMLAYPSSRIMIYVPLDLSFFNILFIFILSDGLIELLQNRHGQNSSYIGCMKSGEVVAEE